MITPDEMIKQGSYLQINGSHWGDRGLVNKHFWRWQFVQCSTDLQRSTAHVCTGKALQSPFTNIFFS